MKAVFIEGLTESNREDFVKFVEVLKRYRKPKGDSPIDEFLREQYRRDCLEIGAAGRLLLAGELEAVLPLEDAKLMDAANPVGDDGKLRFDKQAIEKRENAMAQRLLKEKLAVVILGGSHNLTDNVGKSVEYVRLTVESYAKLFAE